MDFAALVTKEDPEDWFTAEIIVDGAVVKSAQYATKKAAFNWITVEIIKQGEKKNV